MAFLGFRIPPETSRIFEAIDVPGARESFYHITVLMLGGTMELSDVGRAMEVAFEVASKMDPFTVKTNRVSCFPGGEDGTPIICPVESEALHELWANVGAAFDDAGIEYSKKFLVYKPHVTLAYADGSIEDRTIPTIEWGAHELVLWGGDGGDRGVSVHMPFGSRAARIYRSYDLRNNVQRRVVARYKRR